jgi:quinol monooxygenase YgiN
MSFHFLVRFDPLPGKAAEFREELLRVVELTRTEKGCLSILAFESVREPAAFGIHSEWVDEAAFDLHGQMPHTMRFVAAAEQLLGRPVEGLRSRPIGGGESSDATDL